MRRRSAWSGAAVMPILEGVEAGKRRSTLDRNRVVCPLESTLPTEREMTADLLRTPSASPVVGGVVDCGGGITAQRPL